MLLYVPSAEGRWTIFSQMLGHQAQALSRALGLGATIDDPRFAKQPHFASAEDAQAWEDLVWHAYRTRSYAEWEPILLAEPDIAFELVRTSEEGLDHPQVQHNTAAIAVDDQTCGRVRQVGPVGVFSATPARIERSAPLLGAFSPPPGRAGVANNGAARPAPPHSLAGVTIVEMGFFFAMPYGVTMAAAHWAPT
jgi:crotonobetainyl-CoA:carnitine CoA-transferase CaiB-like acyl-CoA transferase